MQSRAKEDLYGSSFANAFRNAALAGTYPSPTLLRSYPTGQVRREEC